MRLGTISQTGPLPPVSGVEMVDSTIYWGDVTCRDGNGQLVSDPAQCPVDAQIYTMQGQGQGAPCFSGYGPPPAGSVYCATACGTGQAWDPISQSCKTVITSAGIVSGQWVPGISNGMLLAGAALIAVLAFTGKR